MCSRTSPPPPRPPAPRAPAPQAPGTPGSRGCRGPRTVPRRPQRPLARSGDIKSRTALYTEYSLTKVECKRYESRDDRRTRKSQLATRDGGGTWYARACGAPAPRARAVFAPPGPRFCAFGGLKETHRSDRRPIAIRERRTACRCARLQHIKTGLVLRVFMRARRHCSLASLQAGPAIFPRR